MRAIAAAAAILFLALAAARAELAQLFSAWSTPVRVAGFVNSPASETCVSTSKAALSLYFARYSPASVYDLYVS